MTLIRYDKAFQTFCLSLSVPSAIHIMPGRIMHYKATGWYIMMCAVEKFTSERNKVNIVLFVRCMRVKILNFNKIVYTTTQPKCP